MRTMKGKRGGRAVSLADLLIAALLGGVMLFAAAPALREQFRSRTYQLEREKQRRTMTEIRNLATAIESYYVDNNSYPTAMCPGGIYTFAVTVGNLNSNSWTLLTPTYIAQPPYSDGWGKPLFYYEMNRDPYHNYEIASTGRNGQPDTFQCGTTTTFNDDIIFSDGAFVQWPEGPQQ